MNEMHKNAFPYTKNYFKEKIIIKRLDEVISKKDIKKVTLLKIEVQGYEKHVIEGSLNILDRID